MAFWDEKHMKSRIGPQGKSLSKEEGGEYFKVPEVLQPKFSEEARLSFGVMMKLLANGQREGVRMAPFNYTGLKMLGGTAYGKLIKAEKEKTDKKTAGKWGKLKSERTSMQDMERAQAQSQTRNALMWVGDASRRRPLAFGVRARSIRCPLGLAIARRPSCDEPRKEDRADIGEFTAPPGHARNRCRWSLAPADPRRITHEDLPEPSRNVGSTRT
ncbi:hypothetical protein T492DRAFT_1152403 [Pavlovales sp. CCMP2436]|nr:hypothetical protein T492DRAFT_1152403 [Pavlovales sp. CCMP2436]